MDSIPTGMRQAGEQFPLVALFLETSLPHPPSKHKDHPTPASPPYLTRMKGLYVNSSAMVEGMVGSPLSYFACNKGEVSAQGGRFR